MLLPNTSALSLAPYADDLRAQVEALQIPHPASQSPYLTISLGAASTVPTLSSSPITLIAAADQALYRSKEGGRNRLCIVADEGARLPVDRPPTDWIVQA